MIATDEKSVLSNQNIDQSILAPCQQEEADTQMFLHAFNTSNTGTEKNHDQNSGFNFSDLSKINTNCIIVLYYYCFI